MNDKPKGKFLTLSEFRRRVGIPLVWARHLALRGEVKAIRAVNGSIRITESETVRIKEFIKHPWSKASLFLKTLGPGLITGAFSRIRVFLPMASWPTIKLFFFHSFQPVSQRR
jgi:hypothetical protein